MLLLVSSCYSRKYIDNHYDVDMAWCLTVRELQVPFLRLHNYNYYNRMLKTESTVRYKVYQMLPVFELVVGYFTVVDIF